MRHLIAIACFALSSILAPAIASFADTQAGWPKEIRFAVIPVEAQTGQFEPLFKHIERELGIPVVPFQVTDTSAVIVAFGAGQIEASRVGAEAYVVGAKNAAIEAVAVENRPKLGTGYYSGLWVRSDSGIKTVADAKGRSIAFGDSNSTSGYVVPMVYFLRDLKVKPHDYFSRVIFAGDAIPTLQALTNKQVDIAAISFTMEQVAVDKGIVGKDEVVPLWKSDLIPNPPYIVRSDLPQSFKSAFQKALLDFTDSAGLAALPGKPESIVATTDKEYDSVRTLSKVRSELQAAASQ